MFELVKQKLSLKISLILALITIPPMVAAAYIIVSRQTSNLEDLTIDSARLAATTGAKMYSTVLEVGIDTGFMTAGDVLEPVYEEIKGFDFGANPRFHTGYDFYTDRTVLGFEDRILASSPDFLFAAGTDVNGYVPTHNSRYTLPFTGDRTKDLSGNRSKRKFTDAVGSAAANNLEPVLVQSYVRDTGEKAWDVSAPVFVKNRHFGTFRVGVALKSLAAHQRNLVLQLVIVFGFLAVVTIGFIFLMLRRSMRPLEHLASLADDISTGEGLDQPIRAATNDEIGRMATSLNRLRASLRAAMGRIGE